jgi:hypothetical protein
LEISVTEITSFHSIKKQAMKPIQFFIISLFISMLFAPLSFSQEAEQELETATWDLRCYPNPTSDLLVIQSSIPIKEVTVIDLNGDVVKVSALPNWCFSLHELPSGWLFFFIENENGTIERKNVFKQ